MGFELVIIAAMIAFNSVFAAYEIALASVGLGRLHALVAEKRAGAAAALRMKESMEASLAVVQLGITLVGAVAAATGGAGAEAAFEPVLLEWGLSATMAQLLSIALVVVPLTIVTILFGELVPKVFALRNKEWLCLKLSPPMEWFSYSVWPAVWFFETSVTWIMSWTGRPGGDNGASDESAIQELRGAASLARISKLIGRREEGIIVSASQLASTPLKRIMLPAEHMGILLADQPISEALDATFPSMHTRYPLTEEAGNPQRIVGYANMKDIAVARRQQPPPQALRELMRPIRTFEAEMSVARCLEQLMRERQHIALVRERGRIVGLVTLEDIIEEIIGEIHDEHDRLPSHLRRWGNGWLAGGFVSLTQLRREAGIELPALNEKPVLTLNDWIQEYLGRPPTAGDTVDIDTCLVIVRRARQVLVHEAYLVPKGAAEEEAE